MLTFQRSPSWLLLRCVVAEFHVLSTTYDSTRGIIRNNGTFRWTEAKDVILLREVRVIEPYIYKVGSKEAGQKWSELATNLNEYDGFKEMPRDQRSVREHFNKLVAEFKTKMRKEEGSTGISPDPPTEKGILLQELVEIMASQVPKEVGKNQENERKKALDVRNKAMKTWSQATKSGDDDCHSESESDDGDKAPKKRARKRRRGSDALKYLETKSAQEVELKREEFEFRKGQAELEQKRIQLEQARQEALQQQLQHQQQQLVVQQQQQAEQQRLQLNIQQQLLQQQMQSQNLMVAFLEKFAGKGQ